MSIALISPNVKEVNPLKQGLKLPIILIESLNTYNVKEVNPLKQGLKRC